MSNNDLNWTSNKTKIMKERLGEKITEKNGQLYFQDYRIIYREQPIDDGVYLGAGAREAIYVNSKGQSIQELYKNAKNKLELILEKNKLDPKMKNPDIQAYELSVLIASYETVKEIMPNKDVNLVNQIIEQLNVAEDGILSLDNFIDGGFGVCRHRALAIGILLELFKKEGYINGKISIERNSSNKGGHAWCKYTRKNNKVIILDEMQDFIGTIDKAEEKRKKDNNWWNYTLSE